VKPFAILDRVKVLQGEIAALRAETKKDLQRRRHSQNELNERRERELRLYQILDELDSLTRMKI
jgi:hypothetical protein